MAQRAPLEIKVCIIGDSDVGKTSLSMRYCHGSFPENTTSTIGASFLQKRMFVGETDVSLQIWDTAGQERFRSMAPMYYRGARAALMVFDVTYEESYSRVTAWLRDLKAHADPEVILCLVANKCDKKAAFDLDACEAYAATINATFIKTSAVTGEGINEAFETISEQVVEINNQRNKYRGKADTLKLNGGESANKDLHGTGSCC